mgnify:CR=1 FL=1
MPLEILVHIFELVLVQVNTFQLMILKDHRDGPLEELDSLVQKSYAQHFLDLLLSFQLLLCRLPTTQITT